MRRYHSVITAAAVRVSRNWGRGTSDEIDDIIQEVYLKLCDRNGPLLEFQSAHQDAFFGFIKVVATNSARDFFRLKLAGKRGANQTTAMAELSEQTAGIPSEVERHVTLEELQRLLIAETQTANGVRDRAIFQFYYRDGMTAAAISKLPGVGLNAKGVEGVLHRLTRSIRVATINPQEKGAS